MDTTRWLKHFQLNGSGRAEPNWTCPLNMEGTALLKVRRSIQQFQLGDGGGPAYLIAWNRQEFLADPSVKQMVDLWFREEAEHSRLLGEMLKRLGGEPIQTHWSFELFCNLRKYLGVRFELHALLVTEIVSHVYYKMLKKYGGDQALREMCQLIIRDEAGHIAFHRDRLSSDFRNEGKKVGFFWATLFRIRAMLAGTVLWINHRGALLALGASDSEFYRRIWRDTNTFIRKLNRMGR